MFNTANGAISQDVGSRGNFRKLLNDRLDETFCRHV